MLTARLAPRRLSGWARRQGDDRSAAQRRLASRAVWVGVRLSTFEACSAPGSSPGVTHFTARWIAQPPKVAFVTRLRPGQSPSQTARQLPGLSTAPWVEPSSTGDARLRGARVTVTRPRTKIPAPKSRLTRMIWTVYPPSLGVARHRELTPWASGSACGCNADRIAGAAGPKPSSLALVGSELLGVAPRAVER